MSDETTCASCICTIEVENHHWMKELCSAPAAFICQKHLERERAEHHAERERLQAEIGRLCAELRGLVEAVEREDDARAELAGRLLALRRTAVDAERSGTYLALVNRYS